MAYTKVQWRNNQSPPINADNLNHIEEGIYEAHQTMAENTQGIENLVTQSNINANAIASEAIARQQADSAETLAREQADNLLSARMDTFTQLPSGSTSGDAELIDIRVGASTLGSTTYPTAGDAVRGQVDILNDNLLATENNIGVQYIDAILRNGTPPNSGNANAVCFKYTIPIPFDSIVEVHTDRPNTEGYSYYYGRHIYNSSNVETWSTGYPNGEKRVSIDNRLYKYINFALVERDTDGNYNPLRITDFVGYRVWISITYVNNVYDLRNNSDILIPTLRNGSVGNPGNVNSVATLMTLPINVSRRLSLEYLGELNDGDYIVWTVYFLKSSAKDKRSIEVVSTSDQIAVYEITGEVNSCILDLQSRLTWNALKNAEYFAFAISVHASDDSYIPLRINNIGNILKVNYFNDVGIQNLQNALKTIIPRESFVYLSDGGKFTFRTLPRFGASTGRCAFRTTSKFVFSHAGNVITETLFSDLISQIGENDTLIDDDNISWIYLRAGYALVFDLDEKIYKTVTIQGASSLNQKYAPILLSWSHQFVGGMFYSKIMDDMYAVPTTLFNSSNVFYDIDIEQKATEFTNLIGANTDTESFLFFTDPHTYSRYWNNTANIRKNAEYLQTVIQKYYNSTPTSFVLCGGDWLTDSDTQSQAKYKLGLIEASMEAMVNPYYPMFGNHDSNYQGVDGNGTANAGKFDNGVVENIFFRKWGKNYYNFKGANTTFYILDSQLDGAYSMNSYLWQQVDWFGKALEVENSEHIAVGIHIWMDGGTLGTLAAVIRDIIIGYNNRDVMQLNNITYDFTEATGRIEFVIAGHTHADSYETIDNSVPVIITKNAWANSVACFDLVFVDYTARTVNCVRVGTGDNRQFSLDTGEPII